MARRGTFLMSADPDSHAFGRGLAWAGLLLLGLLGFGGAAARPGGLLLGLPGLLAVAGVLAALGLVRLLAGPRSLLPCAGLALVPLLLLSGLPVPGRAALSGPPLLALLLAGLAVGLAGSRSRLPGRLFFPVVLLVYLGVSMRVQLQVGPEGDEPHYLMVADSLLRDHDVSLEKDYREGRYYAFYDRPLLPHYRVRGKGGEIYSIHAVGLSLVILPAYALGGYPAVSFFMALLAALTAREIRLGLRQVASEPAADGLAWAIALSPPLIHYAGLVFTEVPAALLVAAGLRHGGGTGTERPWRSLALGAALAFLPWLNVRYAPLAAILLAYAFLGRPSLRRAAALALPALASAVCLAAYHHALYGFFDPRRVYGRRPELALATLRDGLPGLLLDQEFGLLVYAPLFALAVPGLWLLFRQGARRALTVLALVLTVLLVAGSWPMWRGGFNPPARFLVPVIPALALALAAKLRRGLSAPAALLLGFSLFTGLAGAAEPRLVDRDRDGTAPLFRADSGAEEWTRLLPGYVLAEPDRGRLAAVWAVALGLAALAPSGPATGRGFAGAALGLLASCGVAGHLSGRASEGRDAIRVLGKPALAVPGWRLAARDVAVWTPRQLGWGPVYEPHRHAGGAVLGGRLPLAPGTYRMELTVSGPPMRVAPLLELSPEPAGGGRSVPLEMEGPHLVASFEVRPQERAMSLLLRGGDALVLRQVRLMAQPFRSPPV